MPNYNRPLFFQLHIRPMFRATDRDAMLRRFDLWDEKTFYDGDSPRIDFIKRLYNRLSRQVSDHDLMPPTKNAGPWPQEWLDIYKRWMAEGCRRLRLGNGFNYDLFKLSETEFAVSANLKVPENSVAWFQRRYEGSYSFTYHLYVQDDLKPEPEKEVWIEEVLRLPTEGVEFITVLDENGEKRYPLPREGDS